MQGFDAQALDRWLTTEPDNGFTDWCESVENEIGNHLQFGSLLPPEGWFDYLHIKGFSVEAAAVLICKTLFWKTQNEPQQ